MEEGIGLGLHPQFKFGKRGSKTKSIKQQQRMKMCLINPWSICNKADIINDFIIEHDIDVLALTETWLTGTIDDEPIISAILPSGYGIIHAPRGSRGGGIAVIYRQSLDISRIEISHQSFEVLECVLRGSKMLRVCVIYQPHRTTAFLEEFTTYILHCRISWTFGGDG